MLSIKKISITQFKNYNFSAFSFTERVVGICGLNGKGKTNLLDAIHYLCFTKSYFSKADAAFIQFDKDGFRLEGAASPHLPTNYQLPPSTDKDSSTNGDNPPPTDISDNNADKSTHDHIVCIFRGAGKKDFLLNGVPYAKYSEHIGKYPCVMIEPDDIGLITGGSEDRRKFLDTLLSQIDPRYLQHLIVYNKVLQQRNSLLKRFAEQGKTDEALLEVLNQQLQQPGSYIYAVRKDFTAQIIPLVQQFYKQIANNEEQVTLQYDSQLNHSTFTSIFNQYREKDRLLQRTNGGIHKDDISIALNGQVFKNIASQGQRKSLLFALKLAEFELLKQNKGFAPLLLLDDVFEKLDDQRMQNLLHWVCNANNGQVFITDTQKKGWRMHLSNWKRLTRL